jgi:predicted hydrolase (HD superfamily)
MELTRAQALSLLKEYNKDPFHLRHALTVEAVMNWYARELGYGDQAAFWATVGLLHDLDFELWPEEHCVKVRELMEDRRLDSNLVHAVVSHGWGITGADAAPEHTMEKVLFAADELTGLIGAAALMRPSKSTQDMELSSLKKKFKDKKFAAGCSRETISKGAELLGWSLDELLERTLQAMRSNETHIEAEAAALGG